MVLHWLAYLDKDDLTIHSMDFFIFTLLFSVKRYPIIGKTHHGNRVSITSYLQVIGEDEILGIFIPAHPEKGV